MITSSAPYRSTACSRWPRHTAISVADIGTTFKDPHIDYAMMAKTYGLYSEGPIGDPKDLAPALRRAIEVVKKGEPALLDVVTQPR